MLEDQVFRVPRSGGPPSKRDVDVLEASLGCRLPEDYREFLLATNARQIRPCVIPVMGFPRGDRLVAHEFTCFCPQESCDFSQRISIYAGRVPKGMLPLASDPGGNLFVMDLNPSSFGTVSFWERAYEVEEGEAPTMDNVYNVAPSFSDFLARLVDE